MTPRDPTYERQANYFLYAFAPVALWNGFVFAYCAMSGAPWAAAAVLGLSAETCRTAVVNGWWRV